MKNLEDYSIAELQAALDEKVAAIKKWAPSPVGKWKVSTEGDCDGRSTHELGFFDGHIADIAAALAKKSYYSLKFSPVTAEDVPEQAAKAEVAIQLDIESGTWDSTSRAESIRTWLESAPAKSKSYEVVEEGGCYGGVNLKVTR